jgi:hypothetical protein
VRSFAIARVCQPARTGRPGSLRAPVSVGVAIGAGHGHANALNFALGVGLHVGIAVTDTEAFLYAVAVSLAVAPGDVAAVALISQQTRATCRRFNYRVGA